MPKRFIRFNLQVPSSKADLFLRDPNANFMVVLEKKIFALDKQLLMPSAYFKAHIQAGEKSVVIHTHINPTFFEKMLGCFYGVEAAFQRHSLIDHVLAILSLLRVKELDEQLKSDMNVNFQQYGLFNLFYLSRTLGLKTVEEKCLKQLIDEEFQQINYNKYDLFQLNPELFTFILKEHERLKNKRSITGLDISHIRAVVDEYSKTKNAKINVQQIIKYGRDCQKQSLSDTEEQEKPTNRRRNATWTDSGRRELKVELNPKSSYMEKTSKQFSSDTKIDTFQQKENEVIKIKMMNSNMQENNNKLVAEIKSVKNSMGQNVNTDLSYGVDDLEKKLKQFSEKSKNAQKRMEELKNKMMKINLQVEKDEGEQESPEISKKADSNNKMLITFSVLQKQQNIDSDVSDM